MATWSRFSLGEVRFDPASLPHHWALLHRCDAEPLPADGAVLQAWVHFHNGDFQQAAEAGLQAGGDGVTVANKATSVYARYLEKREKSKLDLLLQVSARAQAQQASERAALAEAQAQQASERAATAETALTAALNSSSWRLTAPLRLARRTVSAFLKKPAALKPFMKSQIKLMLAYASLYVNRRPRLSRVVLRILDRLPTLKARLRML